MTTSFLTATEDFPAGELVRPRRRSFRSVPLGLLAASGLVAVLVALPVPITIVQALQGGLTAAVDAIKATSARTLLLHTFLVALVATPVCGVIGVAGAWFVERTTAARAAGCGRCCSSRR